MEGKWVGGVFVLEVVESVGEKEFGMCLKM